MHPLKKITPTFFVTGQVGAHDIGTLVSQGFKAIINNRPDHEEPGQSTQAEITAETKIHKVAYIHIPVVSGQITQENIDAFAYVLENLPGPVVAFCRSGTRSATMWALAMAPHMPADEILKTAAAAGYDLSELRADLEKRKAA